MLRKINAVGFKGVIICVIPLFYQLVSITGVSSILMYIPLLIITLLHIKQMRIPTFYSGFGIAFLISYFICTILSGEMTFSGLEYIILIGIFYFTIPIMGKSVGGFYKEYIELMTLSGAIILLPVVLLHIREITINQIISAMQLTETGLIRDRISFGFNHPNTAGYILTTEIILINTYTRVQNRVRNKIIAVSLMFLFFIAILGTGSRTAVISIILFFVVQLLTWMRNLFPKLRTIIYISIIVSLIYIISSPSIIGEIASNSSGRNSAIQSVYLALKHSNRLAFGTGIAGISSGNVSKVLGEKIIIDGWYVHMFASTGFIGFISILLGIISLFIYLLKNTKKRKDRQYMLSLMACLLCYGLAENVIFVPGVLLSVVCWILFFSLYYNKERRVL